MTQPSQTAKAATNATYGPYSPVRQAGQFYYISGQVGISPGTGWAAATAADQMRQVLQNLTVLLADYELTPGDVVKTTLYLTDMADFASCNQVYTECFSEPRPARTCIAVAELPRLADVPLLVELEAVAYKPEASA